MSIKTLIFKGIHFLTDQSYRTLVLAAKGRYNDMTDFQFLSMIYQARFGKTLDLNNPQTFNEKMQWLKLYDRREEYSVIVDKYRVRKYIADKIGAEYLIPLLGVWDNPNEIDFKMLPKSFVLKCNHDSGGLIICKDKSKLNLNKTRKTLAKSLKHDYYLENREWPYKDVPRRIICEQYMEEKQGQVTTKELRDYKFFCFNGRVKCFKIDYDRFTDHHANYYTKNGILLPFGEADYPPDYNRQLTIPSTINQMITIAEKLANGFPFLRVDLYDINGSVYFGELTLFPASGFGRFTSDSWDKKLGEYLVLPERNITTEKRPAMKSQV